MGFQKRAGTSGRKTENKDSQKPDTKTGEEPQVNRWPKKTSNKIASLGDEERRELIKRFLQGIRSEHGWQESCRIWSGTKSISLYGKNGKRKLTIKPRSLAKLIATGSQFTNVVNTCGNDLCVEPSHLSAKIKQPKQVDDLISIQTLMKRCLITSDGCLEVQKLPVPITDGSVVPGKLLKALAFDTYLEDEGFYWSRSCRNSRCFKPGHLIKIRREDALLERHMQVARSIDQVAEYIIQGFLDGNAGINSCLILANEELLDIAEIQNPFYRPVFDSLAKRKHIAAIRRADLIDYVQFCLSVKIFGFGLRTEMVTTGVLKTQIENGHLCPNNHDCANPKHRKSERYERDYGEGLNPRFGRQPFFDRGKAALF